MTFYRAQVLALMVAAVACGSPVLAQDGGTQAPGSENKGPSRVAVLGFANRTQGFFGEAMASFIMGELNARLAGTGRFQLCERAPLNAVLREQHVWVNGVVDADTATRIGKLAGVRYVISGEILEAACRYNRQVDKKTITYNATGTVVVHSVVTDVEKGRNWKDETISASQNGVFNEDILTDEQRFALCRTAATDTIQRLVRHLVPEVTGRVVAKTANSVVLDIGQQDGIGLDTDVIFYRLTPILDQNGKPVADPRTGEPLRDRKPVQAAIHGDPRRKDSCVGRLIPSSLEATHCQCQAGYYNRRGLAGRRFDAAQVCLDAVQPGDIVELAARPDDVK